MSKVIYFDIGGVLPDWCSCARAVGTQSLHFTSSEVTAEDLRAREHAL